KDNVALLDTYYPEEIFDKYIIQIVGKGFTDIDVRQKPDPINSGLSSLDTNKISREDLLSRILIACADILNSNLNHFVPLNAFTLASFVKKVANRVGKPYSEFIDLGLYKLRFSLQFLESAKGDRVKRPAISSVKEGYHETTLSKGASLVIAKYEWFEVGNIRKGFINFQAQLLKACPICNICYEKDQLYSFLRSNGCFILRCYQQKQYKPDHKGLEFEEATNFSAKPKQGIVERIDDAISNSRPLKELSEMAINKTTTLREIIMALKDKVCDISSLSCYIWISYQKSLSNESKSKLDELKASGFRICNYQNMQGDLSINEWDIIIVQVESLFRIKFTARPFVAILDEANAIMCQMSSGTNAWESENAMHDVLRFARHVLAIDAFANISTLTFLQIYHDENIRVVDNKYQPRIGEMVEFIYDLNSEAEAMRIGYEFLRQGKRVAFVSTGAVMARALIEKASKLLKPDNSPIRARVYYGNMNGKQRQKDFSNINIAWGELDCVAYTNTVEAGISFEITGHFDIVIAITNITTPVHVEAFTQMLYRIRDCPHRIVSVFYQKNFNELFCSPGRENIQAELESAWPNNLPIAIKGHCEWNNNTISYKVDSSPAVITFIEVKHQKHLSARYFIEKLCSLIAIRNEIRAKALVIKNTDFNAVATSRNLSHEEAKVLKFDQERSIPDTIVLKRLYMRNLYCKDMSIEDWNNICNKKFVKNFSSPEAWKHFLWLFYFRRQGHDEENAIKGLKAEENVQWEIACYKAEEHLKKSVAEDLRKFYSANHWKAIRELFQILGFTGIDDKHTLPGDTASELFMQSCKRFIEIQNQSLLLFGPKGQQVRQYSYRINHQPYDGLGFGDKGAPELPPYRPKTDNNIQEVFDSIGQEK
ncbi:37044_t:CDS:2, partial [Gigaspora margarita]